MKLKVPTDLFIKGISERKIYYFSSEKISSSEPHFYVCIKRTDDGVLILSCCTSQFNTIRRFVESRRLPNETLVPLNTKDRNDCFTKPTYVNCNEYYAYTIDDFRSKYESDEIQFSGELIEADYGRILIGFHMSPMISQELKNIIPKPEDWDN